ncbi:malate synthase A [Dictyobacter aurantiacus]|uniref:Malate synthase n=1 Tax=Dictyobacter aurantiacus TaxID=1936993 RepID=A0A401ZJY5_9CHLR|nr:malate synthase A [Dictyobacter aurantiacus]GCE07134.1 malate synthase [Dictyobacter aurantiacus]
MIDEQASVQTARWGVTAPEVPVTIQGTMTAAYEQILTPGALDFIALLSSTFEPERQRLLQRRAQRQAELDAGQLPDFLPETAHIRNREWIIAPVPSELWDRRVEITGPVERKMIINALNSGAQVFMADFEDSHAPTWHGTMQGQINLFDAVRRTISYDDPATGKHYSLNEEPAVLFVRPRGWHLEEKHVLIGAQPISASLFDFGLYFYHNARHLLTNGSGPYFYLPKLESHLEARLWNDVFCLAQQYLGIPQGTIKATVLIETILAAFEMDEILYELREHSAGLNCGRWDYIFSAIKKFRHVPDFILPDRACVTMRTPFMRAYSLLTIKTCHHRHAHAIGGMAAQIPNKRDAQANAEAMARVQADKRREAVDGHDGTWVAHPGLVELARKEFDAIMGGPHQIERKREDVYVTAVNLLQIPDGRITERGLRTNISVSLQYLEAWLRGNGCVPINGLMEDAATVEISRAQLWQWVHHPDGVLNDGRKVTRGMFRQLLAEETQALRETMGTNQYAIRRLVTAGTILDNLVTATEFTDFLTTAAYRYLD